MEQIIKISKERDIESYQPSEALKSVIQMAKSLGRPLLLAGKPGTGKTQFAHWYAKNSFGFNEEVFQFNTKSTSVYRDLFYEYDAVSHFRDKKGEREVSDFITLTALGKAIVFAKGIENINDITLRKIALNSNLKVNGQNHQSGANNEKFNSGDVRREQLKSVVLIDEIDKAPRDFPNDLLHEIEKLSFCIKELNLEISLSDEEKKYIQIIITSNDEKNLPDAFLRRCLFHYIEFPEQPALLKIIEGKLNFTHPQRQLHENGINSKLKLFYLISKNAMIDKKPSTSECIEWINYLYNNNLLEESITSGDKSMVLSENLHDKMNNGNVVNDSQVLFRKPSNNFVCSLSILLKKEEDYKAALKIINLDQNV
jgi:MoxR-like ATPase